MKKDKFEKCKTCKNLDKERSNKNWIVCPKMTESVMINGTSKNCENYDKEVKL